MKLGFLTAGTCHEPPRLAGRGVGTGLRAAHRTLRPLIVA